MSFNTAAAHRSSASRRRFLGAAIATALTMPYGFHTSAALPPPGTIPDPDDAGHIAVKGGRIWYRIDGRRHFARGRVPLVILHGGPGASHHYLLPLVALSDERPVVFYDQLDSGRADHPGKKIHWTVARFVSEIDAVRNALGLDRLMVLGSSCGATWAAEYAVNQPQGLVGTILASPFLSAKRWISDAAQLRATLPPEVLATLARHEAAGSTDSEEYHEADMAWIRRHVCRLDPWPDYITETFELFNPKLYGYMWGPSESRLTGLLKDYDLEPQLPDIRGPTLYTCGEFDEATPESTRALAALTPGAIFKQFAGASHMPHVETPEPYISAIRAFMQHTESA